MARAPTPGVSARSEAADVARRILAIKLAWSDETYRIAVNNVPLDHRMAVRKQTGLALAAYTGGDNSIDVDSIAVLVWVCRRLNGQPSLSWAQFARSWPAVVEPGSIEVWPEDTQGRRIDEEGNLIDEDGNPLADVLEVGEVGDHPIGVEEPGGEVEEPDDPQS